MPSPVGDWSRGKSCEELEPGNYIIKCRLVGTVPGYNFTSITSSFYNHSLAKHLTGILVQPLTATTGTGTLDSPSVAIRSERPGCCLTSLTWARPGSDWRDEIHNSSWPGFYWNAPESLNQIPGDLCPVSLFVGRSYT